MCMEDQALKEINELQAQVNALKEPLIHSNLMLFNFYKNIGSLGAKAQYDFNIDVIVSSPYQHLKQHDLDLLNSIKDEFINSNQSCELILESRINSLELEK